MKLSNEKLDKNVLECERRDDRYVLAICSRKDVFNKTFINAYPIAYIDVKSNTYSLINKEEIKSINLSRTNNTFADNELVKIPPKECTKNNNENTPHTHWVYESRVTGIEARDDDEYLIYDIFLGAIDYRLNSVIFDDHSELTDLFKAYFECDKPLYVLDSGFILGPFLIKSPEEYSCTLKEIKNIPVKKVAYNSIFVFEPEIDEYTNDIRRLFVFHNDLDNLFDGADIIDFITDEELIWWAQNTYKREIRSDINTELAVTFIREWIRSLPANPANQRKIERFIQLKNSLEDYSDSILRFKDFIPEIQSIKYEISELTEEKKRLYNENKILFDSIDIKKEERGSLNEEIQGLEKKREELEVAKKQYEDELEEKYKKEQQDLLAEIGKLNSELSDLYNRKENINVEIEHERSQAKRKIEEEISQQKQEKERLEEQNDELKSSIKDLKKQFINTQKEAHEKLSDLVKSKTHFDFIRGKRFINTQEEEEYKYNYSPSKEEREYRQYEDLRNDIISVFNTQNRNCEIHFIDNLLISISQNLFTLFAGLPGTGKTSMARLLTSCISGKDRRVEIPVGRGWTSQKDLLGYYNPLSSSFVEVHKGLHDKLKDIGEEYNNGESEYKPLLFVTLDEANLSPIEHYWSMFINDTDRDWNSTFEINLGQKNRINHKNAIRFIGTINNDHTTERVSPRILDRVNVIYFNPDGTYDMSNTEQFLQELCISKGTIERFLINTSLSKNGEVESRYNEQRKSYKKIKEYLKDEKILYLSPRIDRAMENYCRVASQYMEDDKPLDYFIAQRVLPLISNAKEKEIKFFQELINNNIFSRNSISKGILAQVIQNGEKDFGTYDYFSILGY